MPRLPQQCNWHQNGHLRCNIKILHVVPTYLPATRYGGPIQSVHGLCRALVNRGHHVEVFTTGIDGKGNSVVPYLQPVELDGVWVTYHPSCWPRRLFASKGMAHSLESRIAEFDLVHVHAMFLLPTLLACRTARRFKTPYVLSPRGMLAPELVNSKSRTLKKAWIALFDGRNVRSATAIHVTSAAEGRLLKELMRDLPPVTTIPNGINLSEFADVLGREARHNSRPYALYLGRLSWKKGLDRLIACWVHVPDIQLVIAGNDDENIRDRLELLAAELGISSRVAFSGFVQGQQKRELLAGASLFILPSVSENFAIAVLEAMATGCPVVVSPGVGLAEVVAAEQCGLVSDTSPDIMGPAIAALLADDSRLRLMGSNAARAARSRFGWDRIAAETEAMYAEIFQQRQVSKVAIST
jgi:glycosyltransferase involved in cell wall biosynthesis